MTRSSRPDAARELLGCRPRPDDARRTATVEIVVPVYNEEADLEASIRRLHALPDRAVPAPVARHDRRQRQHRPDVGHRLPPRRRARRRAGRSTSTRRVAAGRCAPRGRASDAPRRRLHGRRPLDRPRRAAPARRAARVRPQRRRDRHPAGAAARAVVRGPKREAISRAYNLLLKADAAQRVLRRAVRVQGDADRRRPRAAAARSRTRAGSSTPSCSSLAEHNGLRIHEVPVDWVDDPDSRVDVVGTARADLQGHLADGAAASRRGEPRSRSRRDRRSAVGRRRRPRRASSCGSPRSASSARSSSALLFALLAGPLGPVARRRRGASASARSRTPPPTAGSPSRSADVAGRARHYGAALVLAALPLALTLADAGSPSPPRASRRSARQLVALTLANARRRRSPGSSCCGGGSSERRAGSWSRRASRSASGSGTAPCRRSSTTVSLTRARRARRHARGAGGLGERRRDRRSGRSRRSS